MKYSFKNMFICLFTWVLLLKPGLWDLKGGARGGEPALPTRPPGGARGPGRLTAALGLRGVAASRTVSRFPVRRSHAALQPKLKNSAVPHCLFYVLSLFPTRPPIPPRPYPHTRHGWLGRTCGRLPRESPYLRAELRSCSRASLLLLPLPFSHPPLFLPLFLF